MLGDKSQRKENRKYISESNVVVCLSLYLYLLLGIKGDSSVKGLGFFPSTASHQGHVGITGKVTEITHVLPR